MGEVNAAVGGLDRATQQNAAMGEECNAAARVLNGEAERLTHLVMRFDLRVGDELADYVPADSEWAETIEAVDEESDVEDEAAVIECEAA